MIAADIAPGAVVAHEQPASAMAAAQQAGEQSLSLAHRAPYHHAFAVGIVGDQPLVPFIVRPGQVTLVMVDEQARPICASFAVAAQDTLAAVFERHPTTGSTKGISTGVNRVG